MDQRTGVRSQNIYLVELESNAEKGKKEKFKSLN